MSGPLSGCFWTVFPTSNLKVWKFCAAAIERPLRVQSQLDSCRARWTWRSLKGAQILTTNQASRVHIYPSIEQSTGGFPERHVPSFLDPLQASRKPDGAWACTAEQTTCPTAGLRLATNAPRKPPPTKGAATLACWRTETSTVSGHLAGWVIEENSAIRPLRFMADWPQTWCLAVMLLDVLVWKKPRECTQYSPNKGCTMTSAPAPAAPVVIVTCIRSKLWPRAAGLSHSSSCCVELAGSEERKSVDDTSLTKTRAIPVNSLEFVSRLLVVREKSETKTWKKLILLVHTCTFLIRSGSAYMITQGDDVSHITLALIALEVAGQFFQVGTLLFATVYWYTKPRLMQWKIRGDQHWHLLNLQIWHKKILML